MLAWSSGTIVAHPMMEREMVAESGVLVYRYCAHQHLVALSHLLCPGAGSAEKQRKLHGSFMAELPHTVRT